jgi:cytidine deaminase
MADDETLIEAARRAREHALASFSQFKVGAALETADGQIITGCNIENATYGLTLCAERVAMFKAISEGHRQILWEFGGELEVLLANLNAPRGRYQLRDLLPLPFDARLLR